MRRRHDTEAERAERERKRLAELEQPKLDPAKDCPYCYGSGVIIVKVGGYDTSRPCDHKPIPF